MGILEWIGAIIVGLVALILIAFVLGLTIWIVRRLVDLAIQGYKEDYRK